MSIDSCLKRAAVTSSEYKQLLLSKNLVLKRKPSARKERIAEQNKCKGRGRNAYHAPRAGKELTAGGSRTQTSIADATGNVPSAISRVGSRAAAIELCKATEGGSINGAGTRAALIGEGPVRTQRDSARVQLPRGCNPRASGPRCRPPGRGTRSSCCRQGRDRYSVFPE